MATAKTTATKATTAKKKTTTTRKTTKAKTTRVSDRSKYSVEKRWKQDGESGALEAIIMKYAKMIDLTDSGRDLKPLASGMLEAIDRMNALKAANGAKNENKAPVFQILDKARTDAEAKLKAANGE